MQSKNGVNTMDKILKKLFDYQRFERNKRLEKLISETESRYARDLSDEELAYVNAAGGPEAVQIRGGSTPQKKEQIGGITGRNDNGTVTGHNTGGLIGDFIGSYVDDNDLK